MNAPLTFPEQLSHALAAPTRGVLGLVDDLLAMSREHGIQLHWQAGHCRVRLREGGPAAWVEVPLGKAVVRAALARVAVLCNQRNPNSVSPYGGKGELLIGTDPTTAVRVEFVNTTDEQRLELASLRNEGVHTIPEGAFEGPSQEMTQSPGVGTEGSNTSAGVNQTTHSTTHELSELELAILGSLMDAMLRGGHGVLLDEDLIDDIDKRRVAGEEYLNALSITIGVRPRTLDSVVIRRLMGSVISHWIRLKDSLGLIAPGDMGTAIHHAAAQFANAFPLKEDGSERE
jgi:hypothetical protein